MLKIALYTIGGLILLAFVIFFIQSGDWKSSRYILAAGIAFVVAGYESKINPKFAWILLIIFLIIFGLALLPVLINMFSAN